MDLLVYGNEKGELYVKELPFLATRKRWEISNSPVLTITLSKENRHLICGCGNGEFVVLADPNPLNKRFEDISYKTIEETKSIV